MSEGHRSGSAQSRDRDEILGELKAEAEACHRCRLHETRTNVVFSDGPSTAKMMIVSEAPGFTEDQTKIPFTGTAGKYLNGLLHQAGLSRKKIYLCNVCKCHPPKNRDPLPDEIEACSPFLEGQISAVKPKLILALGRVAAGELLRRQVNMNAEHGTQFDCTYFGLKFKLFITYHPAAARYGFKIRSKLEADFKKLGELSRKLKLR